MNTRSNPHLAAFTLIEGLFVVCILAVLIVILLPALARPRRSVHRWDCSSNLKQTSLAFKQWALDNNDKFPMQVSVTNGGTMELIEQGNVYANFLVMSNELNTPSVLVCPSDRGRRRVRAFSPTFSNSNVSYFVGIEASDAQPQMFLAGDRNIWNGLRPIHGVVGLTTNNPVGWGQGLHNGEGNIALADGSVQGLSSSRLREALRNSGAQTNWLQLP